ncbi:MAG: NAD(P)-dependent oxidoreductase [Candidatus Cloacimonetes bacterium]|nr:NAD(P)-dependent oxidoreductase [Candidatus Cloacimonadota bacterium]
MNKSILLTGATGFIGRNVARVLASKKQDFAVLVRPGTNSTKLKDLTDKCEIVELDLSSVDSLKDFLDKSKFETVIHIGALRGGRKYPQKTYYDTNVKATEQIILNCLKNDSKLLFCSSVGVYGAIPQELPANVNTVYQSDNFYHYTKIKAESIIKKYALSGLKSVILRPTITYGENDYGFPYTLVKLIHRKLLLLPDLAIRIHLAHINTVVEAFYKLAVEDYTGNKIYNIADPSPVKLKELVDFISHRLRDNPYPENRYISARKFRKITTLCQRYGFNSLHTKLRLINYSWFYDVTPSYKELTIQPRKTIPEFKIVIDWYKKIHHIK